MKKILLFATCIVLCFCAHAQSMPPNIDFETGTTSNWTYYIGTVSTGPIYTMLPSAPIYGRHTLTSGSAVDTYGHFPIVAPGGGSYSLKLGNKTPGTSAQRARYNVHVPGGAANYSFLVHYAFVFESATSGHSPAEQAHVEVRAYDSSSGASIPCDSFVFTGMSAVPGVYTSTVNPTVSYKPWDVATLNLTGWGGHTIIIECTTSGCTLGGHFGYGYVDVTSGLFMTRLLTCGAATDTLSAPAGYASYQWADSATFTTIATTKDIIIATPGARTCYAVILTPYAGYGCADTLYTAVIPVLPCAGTPAGGYAYAGRAAVCTDPDTLTLAGYSFACGLRFQWQISPDNITWSDIPGATIVPYFYNIPSGASYYRCIVTCINSGLLAYSTSTFVSATGPVLYSIINPPSPTCDGADFYVSTCWRSPSMSVVSYYGDGICDTTLLTMGSFHYADIIHHYGFPGTYTVKQILLDGTMPVDSANYIYDYMYCSTLPVQFYIDNNSNCIHDYSDNLWLAPVMIAVDSNGVAIDTISATSGFYYQAKGAPGTVYAFRMLSTGITIGCPLSGVVYDTISSFVNLYPVNYVALNCDTTSGFDLVEIVTPRWARIRPSGHIFVQNNLCLPQTATVTMNFSPKYFFLMASPTPITHSANSITWSLADLSANSFTSHYFYYFLTTSLTLTAGDTVNSEFIVTPFVGDVDTTNNYCHRVDTILASCDPNYIEVNPQGCLPSGVAPQQLQYTIGFENTGTGPAHNIHVMDTLSDNVNPRTLEVVAASAEMNIALFQAGGHNVVKFDFPNINLLDSSHHGECDGMVIYKIKTNGALPDGAVIDNRAGIYFDINEVVMTNTVENVMGCGELHTGTVTGGSKVTMFPNPASNELTIKMEKGSYSSLSITNQVGQTLVQQSLTNTQTKVNIKSLPAGLYYVTFKGDHGTRVQKLVKM